MLAFCHPQEVPSLAMELECLDGHGENEFFLESAEEAQKESWEVGWEDLSRTSREAHLVAGLHQQMHHFPRDLDRQDPWNLALNGPKPFWQFPKESR